MQGNPFGRSAPRWMPESRLRALFAAGLTFDEVAALNEREEGWRPSRAAVSRKYAELGLPPRRPSHKALLPWAIRPEHNDSVFRHMLQAESRARQCKKLSDADRKLTMRLHKTLYGHGAPMVVTYHPEVGFALVPAKDWDDDIIRPGVAAVKDALAKALTDCDDDMELADLAARHGASPEFLENAGRDAAADILRRSLRAEPDAQQVPDRDDDAAAPGRRRRAG